MNLEHYKNFAAIVDAGTISAASKELLIAQPALSNQVRNLEDYYGAQLLIRNPRHVELTDAGRILYDRIKSISYLEDAARKEIEAITAGDRGTLWLGITPTWPDELTKNLLMDFHSAYPNIQFQIQEQNSHILLGQLTTGQLEVGIVRRQTALPPEISQKLVIEERLMAYYHKDHPLLKPSMGAVPISFLKDQPLSISQGLLKPFTDACLRSGFTPDFVSVSSSRYSSVLLAEDRRTIGIMAGSDPGEDAQFCWKEIAGSGISSRRMIVTARYKKPSAPALTFLNFCKDYVALRGWQRSAEY